MQFYACDVQQGQDVCKGVNMHDCIITMIAISIGCFAAYEGTGPFRLVAWHGSDQILSCWLLEAPPAVGAP